LGGIHCSGTFNSFRNARPITLSVLGVAPKDIARHVGWKSLATAEYNFQTEKVMGLSNTASALADSLLFKRGMLSASLVATLSTKKAN